MPRCLLMCALVLFGTSATAQTLEPVLVVKVKKQDKELSQRLDLATLKVEARVLGFIAETWMSMSFRNPYGRVLAGDLYFPLPEGSTVSGYALDINGVMVDGVVVEKHRARQVYETIVRQGIDPGLVEHVKGNTFKTRVFPIPAKGRRTIAVKYLSDLTHHGAGAKYRLPLSFNRKVDDFSLRVEVVKPGAKPTLAERPVDGLEFTRWRESYIAEKTARNVRLDKDLSITVPNTARNRVLVEKAPDGNVYFCINDFPKDPRTGKATAAPAPKRIRILWDASASRGKTAHQAELDLLQAWLASLGKAPVTVDLVLFRNEAGKPERFVVRNGDAGGLIKRLGTVVYDGGTQMAVISSGAGARPDCTLLFTDGLSNFGKEEPGDLPGPLFVISGDTAANHPFLHYLAARTGGAYLNLSRLSAKDAVARIGRTPYTFASADADRGVNETYPKLQRPVSGRFTLVGRLDARQAKVGLNYALGGRVRDRSQFTVALADASRGDLLRRYWAQTKLADLVIRPRKNADQIKRLGKTHGIVTPGTSLLVLDSLDQYVRYRVRPPKSLPKMRAKWEDIVEKRGRQEEKDEKAKLERIVKLWQQRVKWWQTEFKYPKDFKYTEKSKKDAVAQGGAAGAEERPLTDSAPAPAAREPNRPRDGAAERGDTGLILSAVPGRIRGALGGRAGEDPGASQPGIAIKPWDPKTPYLAALEAAPPAKAFDAYLQQRKQYGSSPAFFLDCADFFFKQKQGALAMQVLSNVAELELESPALLRILAHRLAQLGRLELSTTLFEQVLRLRPKEPQSYRDLALVLARRAKRRVDEHRRRLPALRDPNDEFRKPARANYRRAIGLLYKVVLREWDRFAEIELIALMELNALIREAKAAGVKDIPIDPRLVKLLDCDVRIILTWDADLTDMDLWVTEPSGEKAYYGHRRTTIGANFSRDFTQGYGPEEYLLKKAMPGPFKIQANYYGSGAPKLAGAVTLQCEVFTNYGRPNQQRKALTLRLTQKKEVVTIGNVEF